MGAMVTFNPVTHEIVVTSAPVNGVVSLNFEVDVYSDGKEDWLTDSVLPLFDFPIEAVGGNDLPGGLALDTTFFIAAPWKILPYDADHQLVITGNVYRSDGATISTTRAGRTIQVTLVTTFSASASSADIAASVWQRIIEGGKSAEALLRLITAEAIGNATVPSGAGSYAFQNLAGTDTRIEGTITGAARTVTKRDGG